MNHLRRPRFLLALALLAVNDHFLKGAGLLPTWLTGKASDFAGMLVAPALLAFCLRVRSRSAWWLCHAAVGTVFAAIKLSPQAALAWDWCFAACGLAARTIADPSDLLALPMLVWSACSFEHTTATPVPRASRRATLAIALVALCFCAGSSRHPSLTQNAKAPSQRYVELGSIPIKSESGAIGLSVRQLDPSHSCADVLANPASLKPAFFTEESGGLVEEFAQPIENGDPRALEGRECGVLLIAGETSEWFGFSQFVLGPTYVLWDRRAILEAKKQTTDPASVGMLVLRKRGGKLDLTSTNPLVKLLPAPRTAE